MSKKEKKFFDIVKIGRNLKNKTSKFIHQKILSTSKSLLLVGGDSNPIFKNKLIQKYKSSWKIANVSQQQFQCDYNIPFPKFDTHAIQQIEQSVIKFSKLYQCIILLPEARKDYLNIANEDFINQFYTESPNKIQLGLTTFRLASKFLTTTGTVILSGAQKSFMAQKNINAAQNVLQNQLSYINILLGQRDHTDVDSFALTALVQQLNITQQGDQLQQILQIYKNWSEGYRLPMPGSFAKILKKNNLMYPQYY